MKAYTAAVLRYCPDPVREEFLNVGVLVTLKGGGWTKGRVGRSPARFAAAFRDFDAKAFSAAMDAAQASFDMAGDGPWPDARAAGVSVIPDDDGSIRWSAALCGLTDDPEAALERLFTRFVGDGA